MNEEDKILHEIEFGDEVNNLKAILVFSRKDPKLILDKFLPRGSKVSGT